MSLPSKYPYYCGLLYTAERGLDHAVRNYVLSHRHELEGLAGETCLLFCVDDETESVGPGTRRLKGGEVYEVARQLKVALDALPAAVFFIRPKSTLKVTVRLAAFLPPQPRPEMLTAMFRVFAASMDAASGESHERARLEALRDELTRRQASLRSLNGPDAKFVASTSRSIGLRKAPASPAHFLDSLPSLCREVISNAWGVRSDADYQREHDGGRLRRWRRARFQGSVSMRSARVLLGA